MKIGLLSYITHLFYMKKTAYFILQMQLIMLSGICQIDLFREWLLSMHYLKMMKFVNVYSSLMYTPQMNKLKSL